MANPHPTGFSVGHKLLIRCGWKLSPSERDEVARRYAEGERVIDLAKEFHISPPNVVKLAQARGLRRTKCFP